MLCREQKGRDKILQPIQRRAILAFPKGRWRGHYAPIILGLSSRRHGL